MTGCMRNSLLFESFGSLEYFRKILSKEKERKEHDKKQNILLKASIAIAVLFAIAPASNAMHIMEGYLPAAFCIAWGVICLPFIVAGFFPFRKH